MITDAVVFIGCLGIPFEFQSGLVGYLGYEMGAECGHSVLLGEQHFSSEIPNAAFFMATRILAFDHLTNELYVIAHHKKTEDSAEDAQNWVNATRKKIIRLQSQVDGGETTCEDDSEFVSPENLRTFSQSPFPGQDSLAFKLNRDEDQYIGMPHVVLPTFQSELLSILYTTCRESFCPFLSVTDLTTADVKHCLDQIEAGESYELCLTNKIHSASSLLQLPPLPNGMPHLFALYLSLRQNNPAPNAGYFHFKDFAILSSSPEKFMTIDRHGKIETKPIKGTVPRGVLQYFQYVSAHACVRSNRSRG